MVKSKLKVQPHTSLDPSLCNISWKYSLFIPKMVVAFLKLSLKIFVNFETCHTMQ